MSLPVGLFLCMRICMSMYVCEHVPALRPIFSSIFVRVRPTYGHRSLFIKEISSWLPHFCIQNLLFIHDPTKMAAICHIRLSKIKNLNFTSGAGDQHASSCEI